jgi:hypothetical protein
MANSRDRFPWSHADTNLMTDLLNDGWPIESVAKRLSRSRYAVQGQAKKCGMNLLRGQTVQTAIAIKKDSYQRATAIAAQRFVTVPTLLRVYIEIALKDERFLSLLDDLGRHIEAGDEALVQAKPEPAAVPEVQPEPLSAQSMAPMLGGSIGNTAP